MQMMALMRTRVGTVNSAIEVAMPIKIIIESPCTESLSVASGDSRGFHCASCNKTVMDMRGRTKKESVALLRSVESPCAIFRTNSAGEIVFESERSGKNIISESLFSLAFLVAGLPTSDALADNVEGLTKRSDEAVSCFDAKEDSAMRGVDLGTQGGSELFEQQSAGAAPGTGNPASDELRGYSAKATYGSPTVAESSDVLLTFLNGAFNDLVVLSGFGGMSCLLIAYTKKSKSLLYLALIFGVIAMAMFMVRVSISSFFNDASLSS
jgi:hypothetical protein